MRILNFLLRLVKPGQELMRQELDSEPECLLIRMPSPYWLGETYGAEVNVFRGEGCDPIGSVPLQRLSQESIEKVIRCYERSKGLAEQDRKERNAGKVW